MLTTGFLHDGPAAVRYPRGSGPGAAIEMDLRPLPIGKAEVHREGQKICLLCFGAPLSAALAAGEELDATVVDMRFVKPLDVDLLAQMAARHQLLVTIEENALMGGAGGAVGEYLGGTIPLLHLGLPDRFVEHGADGLARCGLDQAGIVRAVRERMGAD
jgi:1-deoxy-D-xylulose-5-phosphate synthase